MHVAYQAAAVDYSAATCCSACFGKELGAKPQTACCEEVVIFILSFAPHVL